MKFGPVPVAAAAGLILGHNISGSDGRRALRKGKPLTRADLDLLQDLGRTTVYVARLEPGDVDENASAARIARAARGAGLRTSRARTGRVNLYADQRGLLRLDIGRLHQLNAVGGVALATLPCHAPLQQGEMAATLKVIPYALSRAALESAEAAVVGPVPLLRIDPLPLVAVGLVLSGSTSARSRVETAYRQALGPRLERLGATLRESVWVPLEDETDEARLANSLERLLTSGVGLVILAGETAIQDPADIAPRAIARIGGEIACCGAPVDPGNLLLIAYRGKIPILGAPGCARSPQRNIVDLVLPRLLVGDRLDTAEISRLGHGGLLEEIRDRPQPRTLLP